MRTVFMCARGNKLVDVVCCKKWGGEVDGRRKNEIPSRSRRPTPGVLPGACGDASCCKVNSAGRWCTKPGMFDPPYLGNPLPTPRSYNRQLHPGLLQE
ncbi:hypothetical protein AVEN_138284-1 [Araneus ventricosus]|uniref:Uncharacterized protein n=1 Tax=Araneus ventricosus TaxID=182803 RepID=A0A4Y2IT51_ARAVE|nr:hypothetical protein AVEN_138284-1 [Araneus ventricosus]